MSYAESDLLPISALQHLLFCARQCALIHIERLWADNRYTAEGNVLHKKAHEGKPETRDGERIARGLSLRSLEHGLVGVADVVVWRPPPGRKPKGRTLAEAIQRAAPEDRAGWSVRPVEYKRGKPKANDCDRVQLCAQALCLEEMLGVAVPVGDLFYGKRRRRTAVALDEELRTTTIQTVRQLHVLLQSGRTPLAQYDKRCDTCSLFSICLPKAISRRSAHSFFERRLAESLAEDAS